jgi:hypothetical protein
MALSVTFTGIVALVWAFAGVSLPTGAQPTAETAAAPFSGILNQAQQEWEEVKTSFSGAETAADATTTEAVVEADPRELTLTSETLSDVAASGTTSWVEASSTASQIASTTPTYQVVQIVTRPTASSTPIASSSLPE